MSETYVECLVARSGSIWMRFLKTLFIMLTVVFVVIGVVFIPGFWWQSQRALSHIFPI